MRGAAVLSVMVRGGTAGLTLLGHMRARRFPGGARESGTLLCEAMLSRLREGDRELGAIVLDRDGVELARHGFPPKSRTFYECARNGNGHLSFKVVRDGNGARQLDIRVAPEARHVVFYTAKVEGGGIEAKPLLTILLDRGVENAPAGLPSVPWLGQLPAATPLAFSKDLDESWIVPEVEDRRGGFLGADHFTLHPRVAAGKRFDIVFIGDGFTEGEMDKYDQLARSIMQGLRRTQPFKRLDDKINYHIVRAVSEETGIDGFNADRTEQGVLPREEDRRSTYFGFTSDPDSYGAPGYFMVGPMARIRAATRKVTRAWSEVDLVIAIMNCPFRGGVGYLEHRLAAVSTEDGEPPEDFLARVIHECGHAICGLAEEYITSDTFEAGERYPNMATERQRQTSTVWWRSLARAPEKRTPDGFSVVHMYGDEMRPDAWLVPRLSASKLKMLGMFWGAQCVDGELGYDVDQGFSMTVDELIRACEAGRNYYRPMVRCRMRSLSDPFCRVCEHVIADSILAAASGQPRTSLHGVPKFDSASGPPDRR